MHHKYILESHHTIPYEWDNHPSQLTIKLPDIQYPHFRIDSQTLNQQPIINQAGQYLILQKHNPHCINCTLLFASPRHVGPRVTDSTTSKFTRIEFHKLITQILL